MITTMEFEAMKGSVLLFSFFFFSMLVSVGWGGRVVGGFICICLSYNFSLFVCHLSVVLLLC